MLLLAGPQPVQPAPRAWRSRSSGNPYGQAYVYGLMLGPIALPCAGPFLAALLALSVGLGDAVLRLGTFVVFGLGLGRRWSSCRCSRGPASGRSCAR